LLLLAVDQRFQGMGLGTMLLNEFADQHREGPVTQLHLEVRDGNPAVAMYERFGFRAVGRRKDYYRGHDGIRHDAVTMIRDL